jgi:hypothetical protein
MEGLGRLINVIPIATSKAFTLAGASAVTFVVTGNDTWTLTKASSFAGSYTNLAVITRTYTSTATDGTAAWVLATQAAAATVVQTTGMTAFTVFGSQLSDPSDYLKVTVGASGLTTAILHDLTVQRKPANLAILGA